MTHVDHISSSCCCSRQHPAISGLHTRFDELTKPMLRHLFAHARGILPSDDLAWDAVQEALLGLWTKAQAGIQVLDYAGPWLCRAVVLRSLQISRQIGRRNRHERHAARDRSESCRALHNSLEMGELQQILETAMSELPDEFRVVLELRSHEELDYAGAAAQLGVPVGTVRSRLNRARSQLKKSLQSVMGIRTDQD